MIRLKLVFLLSCALPLSFLAAMEQGTEPQHKDFKTLVSIACSTIFNTLLQDSNAKDLILLNAHKIPQELQQMIKRELIYSNIRHFWHPETNIIRLPLVFHKGRINAIAISSDNSFIVTGASDHFGCLWKNNNNIPLIGHSGAITSIAISSNNDFFATASIDHTVRIWDNAGNYLKILNHPDSVNAIVITTNNKHLISCSGNFIYFWSIKTGKLIKKFTGHTHRVNAIDFLDSNNLISGSSDGNCYIWNLDSNECTGKLHHPFGITKFAILHPPESPKYLKVIQFTAFGPGGIAIWHETKRGTYKKDRERQFSSLPHQLKAAVGPNNMYIQYVDKEAFLSPVSISRRKIHHDSDISAITISTDGTMIVTGSENDNLVYIWTIQESINALISESSIEQILSIIEKQEPDLWSRCLIS